MKKAINILSCASCIILVPCAGILAIASTSIPQSGETVVIDDFKYIVVSPTEWADLTNKVATCCDTWAKLNETESGRVALHGKRGHTTITNNQISVTYADGWSRTETIPTSKRPSSSQVTKPQVKPGNFSRHEKEKLPDRLAEIMAKRDAAKSAKPREVTIEVQGGAK